MRTEYGSGLKVIVLEDRDLGASPQIAPAAQEKISTPEGFQALKLCREQ